MIKSVKIEVTVVSCLLAIIFNSVRNSLSIRNDILTCSVINFDSFNFFW